MHSREALNVNMTRIQLWTLGLLCTLAVSVIHAQTTPSGSSATTTAPAMTAQAPDEMTTKITDLVHAGKYKEAQQLTAGLLIAYPTDQRLIKAKTLIDGLLAPAGKTGAVQEAATEALAPGEPLSGMDKVDYTALVTLTRQAQQSTDLDEQKKLLRQFMEQSHGFLDKHSDQMLIWRLRAASALSLNEPMEGYEAGQKLLAAGPAVSADSSVLQLLAQLKNRGWLDQQTVIEQQRVVEHERYTFPVQMLHKYMNPGHLTINQDEAIYIGLNGEVIHLAMRDVTEIRLGDVDWAGNGLIFVVNNNKRLALVLVPEAKLHDSWTKNDVLPPLVIANAVVERWRFVLTGSSLRSPYSSSPPRER
jgi:hypothetical protein